MARYRVAFAALLLAALLFCADSQRDCRVDLTLEEGATGEDVVITTVNKISESGIFRDDFQFLRRMAYVETNFGRTATPGSGGIWAVSEDVFRPVTQYIAIYPELIESSFGFKWNETVVIDNCLVDNICNRQKLDVPLYSALSVMVYIEYIYRDTIQDNIAQQAELWRRRFNGSDSSDIDKIFIERAGMLESQTADQSENTTCAIRKVDMIFVMDESGSIGSTNFELMKDLAIDIVNAFDIGPDHAQVGWINFNDYARVVFNLNTYQNKASLQEGIHAVVYRGGGTDIGAGLLALHDRGFTSSAGARNTFDVPEVAIVVTDGQSNIQLIQNAATLLRNNRNVDVFVVGVGGGTSIAQLNATAEAGIARDISRNIFTLEGFNEEELDRLQETLRARACFSATFSEASIEQLNATTTVPEGVTIYVNTECPEDGLTINTCGKDGKIYLFISKTPLLGPACFDDRIEIKKDECANTFIQCGTESRRKRQIPGTGTSNERIYIAIEGVEENNEYELEASTGDLSTPKVKLYCQRSVEANPQTVVISCTSERMLTEVLCSVNNAPMKPCVLPWRVDITSLGVSEFHFQVNATDSLNLTDSAIIEYQVGPLVLDCSLNAELEIECTSSNQLAPNLTVCSFNGNPCALGHGIDVSGLPAGVYSGHIQATDVFGSSASSRIVYQVVEDRVSDDMVMSVPLDINPSEVGVSTNTLSLCYQVHGEEGKFYNLLSDDCVSVNAHVNQPYADINIHIIDKIGIRAVGNNGTCYDISIERENCAVSINNQSLQTNNHFQEEGIEVVSESLTEIPTIRISVPNCEKPTIDYMFISCTEYTIRDTSSPTDILQFGSTRGKSQVQPPHGLIGQFWGVFLIVQDHIDDLSTPRLPANRKHYDITVLSSSFTPNVGLKPFVSTLIPRSWGSQQTPCLFAGDRQGGPVIQGKYSDYEVNGLFGTQYLFSKFDESTC